ncbi:MAG: hypothetical protein CSYNP_00982 [Syntrophus sp. SKADARSKE-3]|nr:hypothetical protein [Syntrophus sp. SKADARSKE-3]
MKTYKIYFILAILILFTGFGWWFFNSYGEIGKPEIKLSYDITAIGQRSILEVTFTDTQSGIGQATVTIAQDNQIRTIAAINESGNAPHHKTVPVTIDPIALKLHDGPAVLTITVNDNALWKNITTLGKIINVDVIPPQIFLLTPTNHINPGGTCMILYRTSKPVSTTGVKVDDVFFPAYPTSVSGKPCYIAYFAFPIELPAGGGNIKIYARDQGGNETISGIPRLLLKKKFRSDKMALSDSFLQRKMPEFLPINPALRDKPPVEIFIYVNTTLRLENTKTIQAACQKSEARQLWQDTFLRMKDASPMAQFGDKRTWTYNGKVIGDSIHLGVDLASLANAPIEAANSGVVVLAGYLGIYGNAVMIDHGYGISTLYGHMSNITVKNGQSVKRGEMIGNSGLSGLAGGDHLHFSVLVGGQFVNPTEWWDPHWIADNITKKMAVSF